LTFTDIGLYFFLILDPARPAMPMPKRSMVAGSGTIINHLKDITEEQVRQYWLCCQNQFGRKPDG
jgi:hypothetical protein